MINLIRRDVILQKRLLLTFIPFIAFFIIMEAHPVLTFLVASIFIPFNGFAYDGKAETDILLNSLPYTRTEIILSRYLGALLYMGLSMGVTIVMLLILNKPFTMTDIAIGGGLFMVFAAFTFPLFYIFKSGHIFTAVMISFLVLAGIGPHIVLFFAKRFSIIAENLLSLSTPILYTVATIVILGIYIFSWGVTTMTYQRREF